MICKAFVLFLYITLIVSVIESDLLKPERLELNIGQLKINVGSPLDGQNVYVIDEEFKTDTDSQLSKKQNLKTNEENWKENSLDTKLEENGLNRKDSNWDGINWQSWMQRKEKIKGIKLEKKKTYKVQIFSSEGGL